MPVVVDGEGRPGHGQAHVLAWIVDGTFAGLLGRIVHEQVAPVRADVDHVVTGWRIDQDGRKLFSGTALATGDGEVLARTRQTWFPRP